MLVSRDLGYEPTVFMLRGQDQAAEASGSKEEEERSLTQNNVVHTPYKLLVKGHFCWHIKQLDHDQHAQKK